MPSPSELPLVSVIVPVYNDHETVMGCLECLLNQTYPGEQYEVIVVDNGSSPPLSDTLDVPERVQLCHESTPGSYAARNKGIEISGGDILAFTDADCRPVRTWIEAGIARLEETSSDIAGGRIHFTFEGEQPNPWEHYDAATFLDQERYVRDYDFGVTANLFVRRYAFTRYGRFLDELPSSGDAEFCQRLVENGSSIAYATDALVRHPARNTLRQITSKIDRIERGRRALAQKGLADWSPPSVRWRNLLPAKSLPNIEGVKVSGLQKMKILAGYTTLRWRELAKSVKYNIYGVNGKV